MRHQNYALTPIQITNAQPKARPYKLTDGAGLHLVVSPGGTKAWRYQYRYAGVRCDVGIGTLPEIGIADARAQHQRYRSMLERGRPSRCPTAAGEGATRPVVDVQASRRRLRSILEALG